MNSRGYTLLELAVTTALFATIAGWSAVGMGRVVSEFRLHAASESLLGAAGLARIMQEI